ncbi:hypothetical protein CCACVL1_04540 [Corchorus capsularis]|uniref:Uncharacterized protein n=1 Tax=Corchorus capsularis TaxID=210143 RepID=A0A1R3JRE7_COCAP|nr:hypothetical protein CCACVL1_04540 [Corchorus capsularis]
MPGNFIGEEVDASGKYAGSAAKVLADGFSQSVLRD